MDLGRRQFFRIAGAASALAALPQVAFQATARAAGRLAGTDYSAKFTQPLRRPHQVNLGGKTTSAVIDVTQFSQQVLTGFPRTRLYGYGVAGRTPSWPGPTINATAHRTVHVTWRNKLPKGSRKLVDGGHLLPVDATLLGARLAALPAGQKPMVTHLHGAHAEWESDGHPEAWFTQSNHRGTAWRKARHTYDNSQVGGTLWYHDHTHGMTRLNVFAGMAGAYLLHDGTEAGLLKRGVLPANVYQYEVILQDRSFTDDGQLFLNTAGPAGGQPAGGIADASFGDFMMANGIPWPVLDVQPRKYRFRLVNGSDSRIYVLQLDSRRPILVVGTDLGLLHKAVSTPELVLAPGERYDVVLDFSGAPQGTEVILQNRGIDGPLTGFVNDADQPTNRPADNAFGLGAPTDPNSTGSVMKFRVRHKRSAKRIGSVQAGTLLGAKLPTLKATKTRGVITFLGVDQLGRSMEMLGTLRNGTSMWMDPVTEVITKGTTEIWEIYSTSPIAHPIHLHLVNFQVLDRAPFTFTARDKPMPDGMDGGVVTVTGTGPRRAPEPYEKGRKDTVICYPNEVTRVIATFDRTGDYVWHCHILHHEDHDMMRPITVR